MVQPTYFGTLANGDQVELIHLENGQISCNILTFGATLHSLYVPDRDGNVRDVVLGYDDLTGYLTNDGYFGAIAGRYANRIAKGRFSLNGKEYVLNCNDGNNHLHGGSIGLSHRIWNVESMTADSVCLSLHSEDMDEGYPGTLEVRATYKLSKNILSVHYDAISDQDTLCNLTNHAYFNLAGHDSGNILDQQLLIHATQYVPTDAESIPLGMLADVAGTPMDFRTAHTIGERINDSFIQLAQASGYDHNYCLDEKEGLHPVATANAEKSGITMNVRSTLPGVQLYTGNFLRIPRSGKNGAIYTVNQGFCLETQFYPDSPNQSAFPSSVLPANQRYCHTTEFEFSSEA